MSIESPHDLAGLKEVGRIVALTLQALRKQVRAGISTAELDEIGREVLERNGAESAPAAVYGFPGANCISINDEVVHGVPGPRQLRAGDLVKLDVTAQKNGYVADAALTVAVPTASTNALNLLWCAEQAFRKGLREARAGRPIREIGGAIEREARRHGFSPIRELCGHGVGRTIHEPPQIPNYFDHRDTQQLTDGLVITIEPLLTAGTGDVHTARDGWAVVTSDHAPAAHYEHTIVVTTGQPIVLTA
jgi:methionyl aminopeptidase